MPQSGDLYIRFSTTDHGDRDIPPGTAYWLSPAIEILGSGLGAGTAVADVDQLVRVYVGNRGPNTHVDVMVDVYCTNWGTTNPWLQSLGGGAGRPGGPFTVVGGAKWENATEGIIEIGWHPDVSELQGAGHLHVCLFANVRRPGDGAQEPDPPDFSDIATEQHHAQRNVTLSATALGFGMGFAFHVANMGREAAPFVVEVTQPEAARLAPVDVRQLLTADWLTEAQEQVGRPVRLGKPLRRLMLEARDARGEGRIELELEPGQQEQVVLHGDLPRRRTPGLQRFDIVQRDARTGEIAGGARLLTAVMPADVIPAPLLEDAKRHQR